ncbi:MAG TPA: hypothetical protein VJB14_09915 [Planctomycetota bacterium]|nr:hypothetical protein [Planctomycetota bacterium]
MTYAAVVLASLLQTPAPASAAQEAPAKGPSLTHFEVGGNRISIYGTLRMDAYAGDGRFNHTQFTYYALSHDPTVTPAVDDTDNWIDWTPRLSRLGVKVERDSLPLWPDARLSGQLEFDFQNRATSETSGLESESRELPRLRHAFVKLQAGSFSFLAGQTWDLISPLWPLANADGMMWNSGNLGDRRPQVRFGWDEPLGDGAALTTAVAFARTGAIDRENLDAAAGDSVRDGDESARPMIQGRVGMSNLLGKSLDFGVWGHYGWEQVNVPLLGRTHFHTSSVGLDLRLKFLDLFTLSGEAWIGKNLNDVRGGIDQGVDAATAREIAARGGWVELAAQVAAWDTLAGGVSLDDPRNSSLSAPTARSRNFAPYVFNRVDFGGGFTIGVEAVFWETFYLGVDDGRANRYSFFAAYSF